MKRLTFRNEHGTAFWADVGFECGGYRRTEHCEDNRRLDRLAAYEDTGLEPEEIVGLISPPNPPLTLEELREMDGEPVYTIKFGWFICYGLSDYDGVLSMEIGAGHRIPMYGYGGAWQAYRRKPEEGTT